MIHNIAKLETDERVFYKDLVQTEVEVDYSNVIVKKPWGYEYLMFKNDHVAIWMLQIIRKRKTSMHCHPIKSTGLVLLAGEAKFHYLNGTLELKSLDGINIEEGAFHSTEAFNPLPMSPISENGIWVMEIESPPAKADLVRMGDAYGRAGMAYEGTDNMVFKPTKCLKLDAPSSEKVVFSKEFIDCLFTVRKGLFLDDKNSPSPHALISVIGMDRKCGEPNQYLKIGKLFSFRDFCNNTRGIDMSNYTFLTVEKAASKVKISDYIFSTIADLGVKDVFAVSGGGAMHLVDSLGKNESLNYIATLHEQAAAMAAESYARISGTPGVALVTSGPGGTNALTGVCGAWIDSIPTIFISGQVTSDTLIGDTGLRQFGIQESNIVELVKPVTKYAVTVCDPFQIKYHLQKAIYLATNGRPGPVWLDIPLDVQSKVVDISTLPSFDPVKEGVDEKFGDLKRDVARCVELLKSSSRPVLIIGYGVRLAKAEIEILKLIEKLNIPVVSSWTASDLLPTDSPIYVGRSGIMGDRAGNFAVQNSDFLLIIGSRMSIPQVGYNYKQFARGAKKVMVDVDDVELKKPSLKLDMAIKSDAKDFILAMLNYMGQNSLDMDMSSWREKCSYWKAKYPIVLPEYKAVNEKVNSFYFVDVLSEKLGNDAIVVTDMGTSFTCTMQAFRTKKGQRFFTSSGHASMGFGLPGAIGACCASGKKKVVCISGDGALQMNIQELQTIVHYKLPIVLFVLNNNGYLTIKLMQQNHFGRYVGSDPSSGVSCPDIIKLGHAYGIKTARITNNMELHDKIEGVLGENGPFICEIIMPEDQQLIPRVSSLKKPDGTIVSKPLEDLYPFLPRQEFKENMIVEPVEVLE